MRLGQLHLERYGRFTGKVLDFGPASPGQPDLHVVYGPNEAGKSTALNAWLDLVFGIEVQTSYAFQHGYREMRIGAVVETGGQVLRLARIKGAKATLLDEGGRPVAESLLLGPLGGLDRKGLREMFSLDEAALEEGGKSILDANGEAGELLFASGAGLTGFAPALAEMRRGADPFFPGAKGRLAALKAELAAVEEQRRAIDTDARGWRRLAEARDEARAAWDRASALQAGAMAALQAAERQLGALAGLMRLRGAEAALAALPDLPPPPDGWAEALAEEGRVAARLEGEARVRGALIEGLRTERETLVPDPAVQALRDRIAEAVLLRSGHDEGMKDLPGRRREAHVLAARIAAALAALGRAGADPAAVLPGQAEVAVLRRLIAARSGVGQAVQAARDEVARAEAEARQARAALGGDAPGGDVAPLNHLLRRLRTEAPLAARDRAALARDEAEAAFLTRLRAVGPWRGTGSELAALVPPGDGVIAGWKAEAAQAAQARAEAEADLRRLDAALAEPQPAPATGTTLAAAARSRAAREAAWAAHRQAMDAGSADRFEAAMRQDDAVAAGLAETLADGRRQAEDALRRNALAAERTAAAGRLAGVQAAGAAHAARIAAALSALGLPPMAPEAVEAWLVRRADAVEAWDRCRLAQAALGRAEAAVAAARMALAGAMAHAGAVAGDDGLALLLARAEALAEAAAGHQALQSARGRLAERHEALARAEAALLAWQGDWDAALVAAGLPPGRDPGAAADDLDVIERLAGDHRDHQGLERRIRDMEANVAAYGGAMAALADALGLPANAPAALDELIGARLAKADATAARIAEVERKREAAAAEAAQGARALAESAARVAAMVRGFGAADADDLARRLAQAAARQDALREVAEAGEALRAALDLPDAAAARAALHGLDRDSLDADALRLRAGVQRTGEAANAAFARLAEAERQLEAVGGDDAALRLAEARETLLLQIEEGARDHLARRLGLIALDHGLRRYRDRHRSAMIEAASDAFRTITRGAYTGLATQPEGEREIIVVTEASGASKSASLDTMKRGALSRGTFAQLYLALRIAAYRERAARGPVPPFIADDIMETFDDDRAAETFGLLAGMAGMGQVIYLTHHRHLCDIARAVCPGVRLHEL